MKAEDLRAVGQGQAFDRVGVHVAVAVLGDAVVHDVVFVEVELLERIEKESQGLLVYLRQEGRGIGLKNKILAYKLQDDGLDTVEANHRLGFPADLREYGIGAQIIRECGVRKMRLLTNNPRKIIGLDGYGLEVVGRESIEFESNAMNKKYLKTKRDKLGHFILTED